MKKIMLRLYCSRCGFMVEHPVYTNEYGYFAFSNMQCPNDLNMLNFEIQNLPIDIGEVKDANKR